jgi:hypothetical protein
MFGFIERFITLEKLILSQKDTERLKEFTKEQRESSYNWFTCLAYKMNSDKDRASALRLRNLYMQDTKSADNMIEADNIVKPKPMGSFLPDAMKDDLLS